MIFFEEFEDTMNFLAKRYYFKMTAAGFILIAALCSVGYNYIFLSKLFADTGICISLLTGVLLFLLFVLAYSLLFVKYAAKYLSGFFIIANSAALYFMQAYNIAIDKIMMLNVFQTDAGEVGGLLGGEMALFFIVFCLFPLFLLYKTEIVYAPLKRELLTRLKMMSVAGFLSALILLPFSSRLDTFVQEHKRLLYHLMPSNYIDSTLSAIKIMHKHHDFKVLDKKAKINRYWKNNGRKNLFIVVVGESARAANFSLTGYERDTNKELKPFAAEMMIFPKADACGTSTAVSVPCLFSPYGREDFVPGSASYTENVLDVLAYNGYQVLWRENNSSCKGNCNRIPTEIFCQNGKCHDKPMHADIKEKARTMGDRAVIVLHQHGSHGPDYFNRYPEEFEIYTPVCKDEVLRNCTPLQIRNTYDNSITYTSHVMADLLKNLRQLEDEYNIAVIYTSDHGESLGEENTYLHSAIYEHAPKYQKEVPFWVWMPDSAVKNLNYDRACLRRRSQNSVSHDHLFHSLLGLAGIEIPHYNPELDIFAPSRR